MRLLSKRIFDLFFSFCLIIIFFPIFIIVAIMIRLDSNGPIFFLQKRLKKNGEIFKIIKFRTMIINAEQIGTGLFNYKDDPRVTKIGKILRKTSMDELPQLINIFNGDMSFVGPRPAVSYELGEYNNLNENYKKRFTIKPGVTGLAQISGRNENDWDKKVELDNLYIDRFNKYGLLYDFIIIIKTLLNIISMRDIYEIQNESFKDLTPEKVAEMNNSRIINNAQRKDD